MYWVLSDGSFWIIIFMFTLVRMGIIHPLCLTVIKWYVHAYYSWGKTVNALLYIGWVHTGMLHERWVCL